MRHKISRSIFRYEMSHYIKDGAALFLVILGIYAFFIVLEKLLQARLNVDASGSFTSFGMFITLFAFIEGLVLCRYCFAIAMAHGVSRKTLWLTNLLCMIISGIGAAAIDRLLRLIFTGLNTLLGSNESYSSLYTLIYGTPKNLGNEIHHLLFNSLLFIALGMLSWLISAFYYRAGLAVKIAVSITVPALLFTGIPFFILYLIFGKEMLPCILAALNFLFGAGLLEGTSFSPLNALITLAVLGAVFYMGCWLILRRMPVKKIVH